MSELSPERIAHERPQSPSPVTGFEPMQVALDLLIRRGQRKSKRQALMHREQLAAMQSLQR